MIKITVSNIDKELAKIDREIRGLETPLILASVNLVNNLKKVTPVDTGFARDHWKFTLGKNHSVISNEAEYIKDLNAGSSRQAPAYFIEQTVLKEPNITVAGTIVKYS